MGLGHVLLAFVCGGGWDLLSESIEKEYISPLLSTGIQYSVPRTDKSGSPEISVSEFGTNTAFLPATLIF